MNICGEYLGKLAMIFDELNLYTPHKQIFGIHFELGKRLEDNLFGSNSGVLQTYPT